MTDPATLHAARGAFAHRALVAIIEGSPATFERVMAAGTGNLVEAARESGVRRIVLMSALGTGAGRDGPVLPGEVGGRAGGRGVAGSTTPSSDRASSSARTAARCRASCGSPGWPPSLR